jgi:hypothetical protein
MKIDRNRFKAIMDGTASDLTSKEVLIRHIAFDAERRGTDPIFAVEQSLPDVQITRRELRSDKSLSNSSQSETKNIAATSNEKQKSDKAFDVKLNRGQREFIEAQKIPYSRVFDAAGLKNAEYKIAMKDGDYFVAVNVTPCGKYGHRIRSRHGIAFSAILRFLSFKIESTEKVLSTFATLR